MRWSRFVSVAGIGLLFALGWALAASAETPKGAKERFKDAEVTGTVVAYTQRSLSLEIGRSGGDLQEMLLPMDPAVTTFERMAGMTDLQRGDKIRVSYRQRYQKNEAGAWTLKGAVATKISRLGHSLSSPSLKSAEADRP